MCHKGKYKTGNVLQRGRVIKGKLEQKEISVLSVVQIFYFGKYLPNVRPCEHNSKGACLSSWEMYLCLSSPVF